MFPLLSAYEFYAERLMGKALQKMPIAGLPSRRYSLDADVLRYQIEPEP